MLVEQVKEPIAKGSMNCICKIQYQNSAFQSAENLNFENFFENSGPNHGGSYSGFWIRTNV